ncbi:MAG: VWA domain-containing protein, partial [Firmicutes bacterium]|nr:VWA domain-containing protein [Bacillota bacterium]
EPEEKYRTLGLGSPMEYDENREHKEHKEDGGVQPDGENGNADKTEKNEETQGGADNSDNNKENKSNKKEDDSQNGETDKNAENGGTDKNADGGGDNARANEDAMMQELLSYSQNNDESRLETLKQLEDLWRNIAKQIQMELGHFTKNAGKESENLVQALEEVNREHYDYAEFLKKFAVMGEVMKTDIDSFDTNYYCYGLSAYGNIALIEPLEYKEVKRIRDFVIAIDTSGSVSGALVQSFVQKTYDILNNEKSFFDKVNIHIIQCDTEVREAVKITNRKELENYISKMELKGLGGTDFRPVFEYVKELIGKKEFNDLKGLIYFTDGRGEFPQKKPPYETAFVFMRSDYSAAEPPNIPAWAIKLILDDKDIL